MNSPDKKKIFVQKICAMIVFSPAITAFLINAVWVICAYSVYTPYNETNDDTGMTAILTGEYGMHTENIVFSNILYGRFVAFLYRLLPSVNCYSLAQFFIIFLSFWIAGCLIIKNAGFKIGVILYILLLQIFYKDFYLIYQFTRIAMLCCTVGGIWLIEALNRRKWVHAAGAFFWLWIGTLIRYKSFMAIAPVLLCYGIFFAVIPIWIRKDKLTVFVKRCSPYIFVSVLFIAVMLAGIIYDKKHYSGDEAWKKYMSYNRIRADILDYGWPSPLPNYDEYADEYQSIGISKEDLILYEKGIMSDEENLTDKKLENLYDLKRKYTHKNWNVLMMLRKFSEEILHEPMLATLCILSILYITLSISKVNIFYGAGNFFAVVLLYFYLFSLNRVVARAFNPVVLGATITLMCAWKMGQIRKVEISSRAYVPVIALGVFCLHTLHSPSYDKRIQEINAWQVEELYNKIANNHTDIYIAERRTFDFNYNFFGAFKLIPKNFYSRQINIGGWLDRTPVMRESKKRLGLFNFYKQMIEQDNIYLYTVSNEGIVENYLRSHYDRDVIMSVDDYVGQSPIIKFIKYENNNRLLSDLERKTVLRDHMILKKIKSKLVDYYEVDIMPTDSEKYRIFSDRIWLKVVLPNGEQKVFPSKRMADGQNEGIYQVYINRKYFSDFTWANIKFEIYY